MATYFKVLPPMSNNVLPGDAEKVPKLSMYWLLEHGDQVLVVPEYELEADYNLLATVSLLCRCGFLAHHKDIMTGRWHFRVTPAGLEKLRACN
jgi:ribosomal protein S27AE